MSQTTLFDLTPEMVIAPASSSAELHPQLHNLALLYTATEEGNNSGIRFMMSRDHAMAWCSSPVSSGILHGTQWAYHWTSVANFIACHWGTGTPQIIIDGLKDDGSWDERIAGLGLTKISFPDFRAALEPLGVAVVNSRAGVNLAARTDNNERTLHDEG